MVGRAQAVEAPQRTRENEIGKFFPIAPPVVPGAPQIAVRAPLSPRQFGRQKSTDSEKAGLQAERLFSSFTGQKPRQQFRHTPHRPDVLLVAKRGKKPFPERLLPTRLTGARREFTRLALQADKRRLLQEVAANVFRQVAQRRAALPGEKAGSRSRVV